MTDDQLAARVLFHERERAALDARMAADTAVFDGRRVWARDASTSAAAWLAPRIGLTATAARRRMRVVAWLQGAPLVLAALAEAKLTWAKVAVFAEQVTSDACLAAFEHDEEMLVAKAAGLKVEDVTRLLRYWAALVDPELDEDDEARRQDMRSLYLSETWLGMGDLAGNLTPEARLRLEPQLERIMEDLYRDEARGEVPERTTAQRRHDAFMELCRRAAAWDPQNHKAAHPLFLALLSQQWLTGTPTGGQPTTGHTAAGDGDRPEPASPHEPGHGAHDLDLPADHDEQDTPSGHPDTASGDGDDSDDGAGDSDRSPPDDGVTWSPEHRWRPPKAKATPMGGPAITNEIADRLACDAEIARLVLGADGEVLDHGRAKRLFTPAQRRAILTRYGFTCPWPTCDRPAGWLEMHHMAQWQRDHGPTDILNGIPPCGTHHTCLHEGGYTVTAAPNGDLTFYRPDGTPIDPNPETALWR